MMDKDLRHMSRGELLEILIALMEENEKQKKELEELRAALRDRQIVIENAGSLADAAMQLNGVFEAAQAAAGQYLDNLRRMYEQQETAARKIQAKAEEKAAATMAEADAFRRKAHAEADAYWEQISMKTQELLQEHKIVLE